MVVDESWTPRLREQLDALRDSVSGVRAVLLATTDGHPVAHNLAPRDTDDQGRSLSAAAMIAALLGLGERLSELVGDDHLQEATVRSARGYVVVYAVGSDAVMTVIADDTVNIARLNLEARLCVEELAPLLAMQTDAQP